MNELLFLALDIVINELAAEIAAWEEPTLWDYGLCLPDGYGFPTPRGFDA